MVSPADGGLGRLDRSGRPAGQVEGEPADRAGAAVLTSPASALTAAARESVCDDAGARGKILVAADRPAAPAARPSRRW